jgi:hypothetical protein
VTASVLAGRDAWLLHATAVTGHSVEWAAGRLGIGYEAAKKRRQRTAARWWAWWDPPARQTNRLETAVYTQRRAPGGNQEPAA